jgi:hypothetical protein
VLGAVVFLIAVVFCGYGPGLPLLAQRLMRVVCLYGVIAYWVRGLQLMIAQPIPVLNDPVPIPRLYAYGYRPGVSRLLLLESLGLICLYVGLRSGCWASHLRLARRDISHPALRALVVTYGIGVLCRLWSLTIERGPLTSTVDIPSALLAAFPVGKLSSVCFVVVAMVLLSGSWWEPRSVGRRLFFFLALSEIVWSFVGSTKAPVLVLAVGLYLSWPDRIERRQNVGPPLPRSGMLAAVIAVALLSFSLINAYRSPPPELGLVSGSSFVAVARAELQSPSAFLLRTAGRVSVRLDGLQSASAAMIPTRQPYLSPGHYVAVAARALIPASVIGGSKEEPAYLWAINMEHHFNQVALAETTPAEGYAMGGLAGLILSCLLVGVIASAAVRVLVKRRSSLQFSCLVAGALLTSPAIVERGLLGVWATLINFVQVSLVLALVSLLLGGLARRRKRSPHLYPSLSPSLDRVR